MSIQSRIISVLYFSLKVKMINLAIFFVLLFCIGTSVTEDISSKAKLINPTEYLAKVIQETYYELENNGFSSLKLNDFNLTVSEQLYNWNISGTVFYKNGFLVSIQKMHAHGLMGSVSTREAGTIASFSGSVRMDDCKVGYDVLADLGPDGEHVFTGHFTHSTIQVEYSLTKNINTGEFSIFQRSASVAGGSGVRMIYMPESSVSEVLSRRFQASTTYNNVVSWTNDIIIPIMLKKAAEIEFPEICLNC